MIRILSDSLVENLNTIRSDLGNSSDIVIREFIIGEEEKVKAAVIYVDGLIDKDFVQKFILKTLMIEIRKVDLRGICSREKGWFQILKDFSISVADIKEAEDMDSLYLSLLSGDTIILIDYSNKAFLASSRGWQGRGIEEPTSQSLIKGPKEGFTETLRTNTALIRRRIKDTNLRIETVVVGKRSKTEVVIAYINGLADDKVVNEVKSRINQIDVDYVIGSSAIEELIQDSKYSPYPTIYNTERPDSLSAGILEGRVGIIVDGTPFAMLVPALFIHFFQSSEDYYIGSLTGSFKRVLRYSAYFLTLLTPGTLVALLSFHHEMMPTTLFISIAAQRAAVPFPISIEVMLLEVMFEVLREAAVRMPRLVGPTISIVGALVLGQAAVEAGIFSSITIIVIAVTGIASNMSSTINMGFSVAMLRFIFIFLGATFGIPGIAIGSFINIFHLCALKSFGTPYLSYLAPFNAPAQRDTIIRLTSGKILKVIKKKV
ncbi:spore germination protein [Clostridium polyendosporum]|uniref:Spore germination protein n=1 Tax=Clostridium polyendosporum TaxID=69208 RepID=A0A919S086_9CLOT|nr:spore germination protein [Clostridium polyendosporum]GIM28223.1 spore germination protein [Clostridium polyendosporum]